MASSHEVGDRSEARVLAALIEKYGSVLIPFGNGKRYDFVVDAGDGFLRVQVKTARVVNGSLTFKAHSFGPRSGKRTYVGEIDLFGVFCPPTGKVYLIPINDVSGAEPYLRLDPVERLTPRITFAQQYELI